MTLKGQIMTQYVCSPLSRQRLEIQTHLQCSFCRKSDGVWSRARCCHV